MDFPDKSGTVPQAAAVKKVKAPVVTGAIPARRPASRRFMDFVFAESPKAMVTKVGKEVLFPRLKDGFRMTLVSFIDGMFYGNSGVPANLIGQMGVRGGGINYQAVSSTSALTQARMANDARPSPGYQDVVLPSHEACEIVLANMISLLNDYRVVAVGDFNDLIGRTSMPSDNSMGWTTLDGARISTVANGYVLELPRPSII